MMLRRPAFQSRDNAAQAYARLWRDALVARMALAEGVGLGLLQQIARLAPMLAIALIVDKVATSHADATLLVIITGLALLACAESSLGAGRDEAERELSDRISKACRRRHGDAREVPAGTANVASLAAETLLAVLTIPPMVLALLIALWLASPAIAAAALVGALTQAAALRLGASARREDREALRRASTEVDSWRGQAQIASGLDDSCRRAARVRTEAFAEGLRQCQDRVDATRERLRRRTTMIHRFTTAAVLGIGAQAIAANMLTTGGLIVAVMVLRQLQGHVDGAAALLARADACASSAAQLAAEPTPAIAVAPPGGVAVALREATVRFGDGTQPALRITLDIAAGSFVVVTGASGAGKSVLLRLIAGGIAPQSGTILRDEHAGAAIALVAEDPWFPDGSIAEIVRPGPVHTEHADRLAALRHAE
ncbi:MAG: ATP-binding cassette domain-containing protein, partial [Alphaproteobacteria bacterium]|nr:ATP-binding cassette domain-containing protein [Alphaproteobacteria bacterium]